jgi:hypothetical protein
MGGFMPVSASVAISDQASIFINEIVNGKNQTQAAKQAGYAHPAQSGCTLMKSPGIVAKIRQERQKIYQTDLANVATATLKEIITDKDAPQSARIAGCRTVLEVCNMIGKHSTKDNDNRALSEMTPDQLAGLIDTLENTKAAMAEPVIYQAADIVKE